MTYFLPYPQKIYSGSDYVDPLSDDFIQITLPNDNAIASIAAGSQEYMLLTIDGEVYSWIGAESVVKVELPLGFSAVAADLAQYVSCLVGLDGTLRCWGPNLDGENGDGGKHGEQTYGPQSVVLIP